MARRELWPNQRAAKVAVRHRLLVAAYQ